MTARRRRSSGVVTALVRDDPRGFAWVTVVQLAAALTQGLGLLLLVPLLELAGVDGHRRATGGVAGRVFSMVGLSPTLRTGLGVYVVVVAVAAALNAYQSVVSTRFRLAFVDGLRSRLFRAVAGAEWRHLLGLRHSDLLSALVQNIALVSQGAFACMRLGVSMCLIVVQVAVALRISPAITGLAGVTGLGAGALMWPLVRRSRRLGQQLVGQNRRVMAAITEFLDGLRLAKAHDLTAVHVESFDADMRDARRSQIAFTRASAAASALQLVVTAAVLAVVVGVAVERLHLPLGRLLVVAFVFSRLVPQVVSAQQNLQQLAQAVPAMAELSTLIADCETAAEPATRPTGPVRIGTGVRLEHVTFTYPATGAPPEPVLRDVSLDIPARCTTALVGPSGAGKSTLADLAVGLLAPTDGRVVIDDQPLDDDTRLAWRSSVGMAPQEPFLFHDTIRANLTWARLDATDADLWAALDAAAARALVEQLPDGLDTVVGDRGGRLSGGQRQRIALARALLRRPDLLVLDEATSSLDTEHELAVRRALTALHGTTTVLVIAHRLSTVRHADHIAVIDHGRIVETGTWDDLVARHDSRLQRLVDAGELT